MTIQQQITSLLHIIFYARELHKIYPQDEAILSMIGRSQFMIINLQSQQESELQDGMFVEREIRVDRFRDGGSADYYLMPQNVKIASFDMFSSRTISIANCLLSGRAVKVADYDWREGRRIAHEFIKESVGVILDEQGDFIGNVPNFKPKYIINPKKESNDR